MNSHADTRTAAWLGLLLFGIYLVSYSGQLYSHDSMLMFSVTESFVKRGEFSADQMWTLYKARDEVASDGEAYSKTGYGASLFAVPLYALALALPEIGLVQTTLLTSAAAIALAAALVYLAARRLGYSPGVSASAALLFGLATPAWVYAKQFWSEPFALLTLIAAFNFLLRFRAEPQARQALFAGIALGLAVAVRLTNAALVPFFAWYGFGPLWKDRRGRRGLAAFVAVLALAALSIAWYNWVRYGSPLFTGYRADEGFDNPLLLGLYGLLFSPGKGLFVYVPFFAVLPWSIAMFFRRARDEALLVLAVCAVYLVLFSTWYYWWGGTNWGPRFLVPLLPFLVLLAAPAVELAFQRPRTPFTLILALLSLASLGIQLLGVTVPSLAYRLRMLQLSSNPEMTAIFYPQFSPLVGYWSLLKPRLIDFAWFRFVDGVVSVDWLVIALTLALVAFCAVSLYRSLRVSRDVSLRGRPPCSSGGGHRHPWWRAIPNISCVIARSGLCDEAIPNIEFEKRHWGLLRRPAKSAGLLAMTPRIAMTHALLALAFVLAAALALFSLYRYRDDVRFGGGDGYRALLQTVAREARPRDVLVLDDDVRALYFMNANRARIRWYGLSRDPGQWDEATRALLSRLTRQYDRIWLAYDDASAASPDPTRDWLDRSTVESATFDFADGAHLVLYVPEALAAP